MRLSNDLRESLESLNSRGVDYVVVGAHSLAFHARVKIVELLNQSGFADTGFKESDFTESEQLIQLGRPPNRIDLLTSISGVPGDEAFATRIPAELDGIPVFVLSKNA